MSADVVNLRLVRKRKTRADETAKAAENRARFGRTRAERDATWLARSGAERKLDGHLLSTGGERAEDDRAP